MELYFEIAGDQIDGARDYQEDAFLVTYFGEESGESKASGLVVVADGMGGHAAGNIASNLVVSTFNKAFTSRYGEETPPNLLRDSLLRANHGLAESIRETPALDGMGCTMVAAVLGRGRVHWVSVGDSHLYLIRDRELIKKNEDHSYGGYLDRMKEQGIEVEAEAGLSRNMLMSAMTGDDIAEIDCPESGFQLLPQDRLVIASDGLDTLSPGMIIQTSTWSPTPKECVQALLKAVDEAKRPRQDNTTVVVIDVLERASTSTSAAAPPPAAESTDDPRRRAMGDTQPLDVAEVRAAIAQRAEAEAPPAPAARGKAPLVAGLAVALALAGAGGWYFLLGPGAAKPVPPAPSVTASPPVAPTPTPTPAPAQVPAPEPTQPAPPTTTAGQPTTTPVAPTTPVQAPTVSETPPPAPPTAREFTDALSGGGEGPVMVELPAGEFEMGSGPLSVDADERPQRTVRVAPFAMGKYEVTIAQYGRFARDTGRAVPDTGGLDGAHPVTFVSWDDAYAYTQWLSRQTGKRYRLPSEAEWEYAASAGTTTPYWWGFDPGQNRAHCFDCETGLNPRIPTTVGRFEANPFGLHDTSGNVAEWVRDCYHRDYSGAPDEATVWEGGDCNFRMVRGGGFDSTTKAIRSAKRGRMRSQGNFDSVGFRVARDLD
ncbi:MAG: SUMF1/EgtB/PvdO family nonheme iron enzyme [Ectothiorhodospiraceae bacterium]|nr:SUMF1/EgtB/PvdO family nonheme iron enzyme [Chromatiales bacterium]MCP5157298.1 SUMF1/EgtB/PvdO family nonheme iron enzyme [Ectothiorhodospiraceae bacterium]